MGVKTIIHGEHGWDMLDPYGMDRKRKLVRKTLFLKARVVVGDGAERGRLEKNEHRNIIFLGYRSNTDILMKAFDLFVLPSFNEGISNTILEAMATKRQKT